MRADELDTHWLAGERATALATRIAAGDHAAEEELIAALRHPLLMMLRRRTRDAPLADDLTHEALLLLLIRLRRNTIRDPSRLGAFLYRTACNLVLIQRRRNARYEHGELADRVDPALSPLVMILCGEETRLLRRSIAALPCVRDREILHRFYLDEEDKSAIQASLRLTSAHFDRVLHRARTRLRHAVETLSRASGERTAPVRTVPRMRTRSEAIKKPFRR